MCPPLRALTLHACLILFWIGNAQSAEPDLSLKIGPSSIRASWSLPPGGPAHSLTTRLWQLESSTDPAGPWLAVGDPVPAVPGGAGFTALDAPAAGNTGFFRLRVTDSPSYLAAEGSEVMGYVSGFSTRLWRNSGITPESVPALFPSSSGLPQVSYDVATAEYWGKWNADPAAWNAALPDGEPDQRLTDFRPNEAEKVILRRNGFVVSEARGAVSFTDLYYRIWTDDLPVFVTSDSILHAWHRTWITMLEELEELALRPRLQGLVWKLAPRLRQMEVPPALAQGKADAVEFMNIAHNLATYTGPVSPPSANTPFYRAVQGAEVASESFFGSQRFVDWTQLAPRAHYVNSETLKSYFRTMMWLSHIDLRMDERAVEPAGAPRQLAAAVVLTLGLRDAGLMEAWHEIDGILTPFTGTPDALTPPQLLEILTAENLGSMEAFSAPQAMETLLARLMAGQAGAQQITAHPIPAPLEEKPLILPRSFVFFPQRFTPESWAFTHMVFDKIWRENPAPDGPAMVRIHRRLPSALDINFVAMGNNTPAALLAQRMISPGIPHRDGLDFSRELVSLRQVLDDSSPEGWESSLYLQQFNALRTLSLPMAASVPQALRTEAWKWKTVHTQLAGWTELRHDNLLYAKQSYTPPVLCDYPAGYVEPRPEFYGVMKRLVDYALTTVSALPLTGTFPGRPPEPASASPNPPVDLAARKAEWLSHFSGMSDSLNSLKILAEKEIAGESFSAEQSDFLRSLVQEVGSYPSGRTFSGWYPRMYLKSVFAGGLDTHPSELWDPLVVDVHTDAPDKVFTDDAGAVLYNATGNAALMLVAIDGNDQLCLHGGPVFTYYEFTRPYGETRTTDPDWKSQVRDRRQPDHPEWTGTFLVPGPIMVPAQVK